MKIVLAGVPGVGKSTAIQLLQKNLPEVKKVVIGDLIFELGKEYFGKKYPINSRDDLRKYLKPDETLQLQKMCAKRIGEMTGDIVIDTHIAIKTPGGYVHGIPKEMADLMNISAIVLLEFDPPEILERRNRDKNIKGAVKTEVGTIREFRERDVETPEEIEFHQQINRIYAGIASAAAKCSMKVISLRYKERKDFEHAEKVAEELFKMFKWEKS